MRALRDFNTPKIVTDDVPIFMGLIGDLFPALDVPRKRNLEFEKELRTGALALKLQPEEGFILKVVQLQELFEVRGFDEICLLQHVFMCLIHFDLASWLPELDPIGM